MSILSSIYNNFTKCEKYNKLSLKIYIQSKIIYGRKYRKLCQLQIIIRHKLAYTMIKSIVNFKAQIK